MDFPSHFEQIFQQLNYQRVHGQLCDCVIMVGSRHFKAHRSVLAACSTHFRALFTVTEGDASMNMIQLDSEVVTAEAFAALVDMMYTSTLVLGESNVMDVLLAASHLHLNNVVKACKHYLTNRTLPLSPQADRTLRHQPQQDQQRHRQQQQQQHQQQQQQQQQQHAAELAANASMATNSATSRLQRSFLLQQLGLSLVSSALGGIDGDGVERSLNSGAVEQAAPFPIRRSHKRKQALTLGLPDDRPRQRPRPSAPARGLLGEAEDREEGQLLSPDSHKMGEESPGAAGLVGASQDDAQMPSQSDSVHCEGEEAGRRQAGVWKEEFKEEEDLQENRAEAKIKSKTEEEEEEEALEEKVVVKREPLSSPEPTDENSYVTSQGAEGGGPVGHGGQDEDEEEKAERSPESTRSSLSSDPQPRSDATPQPAAQPRPKARMGGGSAGTAGGFGCSSGQNSKAGFSISNFLSPKGFGGGGSLSVARDDELPNTTTTGGGDAVTRSFLFGQEAAGAAGSASLLCPGSLGGEGRGGFGEALFLRPLHDDLGGLQGVGPDPFGLDFQHSALGLHSLGQASRAAEGAANASMGYPGYRRMAPKLTNGMVGGGGGGVTQDPPSSSSSSLGGPLLLNDAGGYDGSVAGQPASLPPQLTRASAAVLSKCKKALSEHNVLVVEGTRKYACKICCKTFLTLTDCKKHIRVHTGEKPYACLKCGKRFSQSSHLYKHSKTTCLRWQSINMPNGLL